MLVLLSVFSQVNAAEQVTTGKVSALTKVIVGLPQSRAVAGVDQYQQLTQFIKAYWLYWGEQYNYHVSFAEYPVNEMQSALNRHDIDIISTGFYESKNRSSYLYSIPYVALKTVLYRHVNARETHKTISVLEPSFFQTTIGNRLQRKSVSSSTRLFSNESDYVWSWAPLVAQVEYEKSAYYGNYISEYLDESVPLRAITRYFEKDLMLDINRGIRNLDQQKLVFIWERLFTADSNVFELLAGSYEKGISQSIQEALVDNPVLTFAYMAQGAAPYFIENDITVKGYYIEYLEALSASMGITFEAKRYDSFNEILEALKKQQVDIFPGLFKTDKRSNYLQFTQGIDQAQLAIVSYKSYNAIEKLTGLHVAAVRGLHETEMLKRYIPGIKLSIFATSEEAMSAVANRDVDAYFGNILNIANLMATMHVSNLDIYKIDDIKDDLVLRIGVNKKNSNFVTLLNSGIQRLGVDFQETLHLGWQQQLLTSLDDNFKSRIVDRIVIISVIVLLIFVLLFVLYQWQYRTRREQQIKIEKALKKSEIATDKAVELARSKTEFLARMSHEIRTPMNGVLGMAEALTFTELSAEQDDLLSTLNSSARNLMALLNDVLDFSKMDAGKLTLETLPTDLKAVLQGVMDTFRHKAASSGLNFNLFVDEKLKQNYVTDGIRLMQVVNNIISNSLKFTEKGYVELRLQLIDDHYSELDGTVKQLIHIEVRDSGIGIPENKLNTLFDPFVQAEGDITRRFGGTGLGLSICKEIVDEMQGTITVHSKIGFGSVFTIALPLTAVDVPVQDKRLDLVKAKPQASAHLSRLKLLLAEDNAVNRKVIEGQLKRLGITDLTLAVNGAEALEYFKNDDYDIVISDCHMPEMDGFELAGELRKLKIDQKPWIIALTADALSGASKRCIDAGFDDYLSKPCPSEVLENKLLAGLMKIYPETSTPLNIEELSLLPEVADSFLSDDDFALLFNQDKQADVISDYDFDAIFNQEIQSDSTSTNDSSANLDIDIDIEMGMESISGLDLDLEIDVGSDLTDFFPVQEQEQKSVESRAHSYGFTHLDIDHVFESNAGDEELIGIIFQAFLQGVENDCKEVEALHKQENIQSLQSCAHRIKGCVLYLGASQLGDVACELELHALSYSESELTEKVTALCSGLLLLATEVCGYQNKNMEKNNEVA